MSEISRKLMKLAMFFDEHPEFDEFPELFDSLDYFCEHLSGDKAARLDDFASKFGVEVRHSVHGDGKRYSVVEVKVSSHEFRLQCRTEDYEAATGKTVDSAVTS